jgi:lipid A 3-O-deacylase
MKAIVALATVLTLASVPARATEVFAGVYGHDVHVGFADCCFESGTDIEFGARTGPLSPLKRLGDFRLYVFGSVDTSPGVSFAAAGLAWRIPFAGRFYFQPGIGGAVQTGPTERYQATPDRLYLGSRYLFEPEAAFGYSISRNWAVEASYVHLSHAKLAGPQNPGIDEVGARAVYRFGE